MNNALTLRIGRIQFKFYTHYLLAVFLMSAIVGFDLSSFNKFMIFFGVFVISCVLRIMGYGLGAYLAGLNELTINFTASGLILKYSQNVPPMDRVFLHSLGLILPVVLALLSLLMMYMSAQIHMGSGVEYSYIWQCFAAVNLGLFFMNLLPILPNDGAQLLQEFLKMLDPPAQQSLAQFTQILNSILLVLWVPMLWGFFVVLGFMPLFLPNLMRKSISDEAAPNLQRLT